MWACSPVGKGCDYIGQVGREEGEGKANVAPDSQGDKRESMGFGEGKGVENSVCESFWERSEVKKGPDAPTTKNTPNGVAEIGGETGEVLPPIHAPPPPNSGVLTPFLLLTRRCSG